MTLLALTFYLTGLLATLTAAFTAALYDLAAYRIPNILSGVVIAGFLVAYSGFYLTSGGAPLWMGSLSAHGLAAGIMFIVTFLLFATRVMGAGDAKLSSALALWLLPHPGLALFVVYTSFFGGGLAVATLFLHRFKPFSGVREGSWIAAAQAGKNRIPYGVAIAGGFTLTLLLAGAFDFTTIINAVENKN